jgi:type II secretory pathway pseudopilin PulG
MQQPKLVWVLGGTTAAIMGTMVALIWGGVRTPVPIIPNPTLPSPNAWDFYVKAGDAIINAGGIHAALDTQRITTLAQQESVVRQNAAALRLLRQGFLHEYLHPPVRTGLSGPQDPLRHAKKFRELTRLLMVEGGVKAAHGDWHGATDSYLDGARLGVDVPHGAPLIGGLVGIACESITRRALWDTVSHLDAVQARVTAEKLEALSARRVTYAQTIQEEKWTSQAFILNDTGWNKGFGRIIGVTYGRRVINAQSRYIEGLIKWSQTPYAAHKPLPPMPGDAINRVLLPVFGWRTRCNFARNEATSALLLTALALHAYRLENGAYPQNLLQLAPKYLKQIPDDPFGLATPLMYQRKGDSYLLYSIGPDGKDDGGKPILNPGKKGNARYFVLQDSLGDVVPGINR